MRPNRVPRLVLLAVILISACACFGPIGANQVKVYNSGIQWPEPKVVDPGSTDAAPPSDAIVLFDGKDLSQWEPTRKGQLKRWKFEEGYGIAGCAIRTKRSFRDCQLHLEWSSPNPPRGNGQGRGNNGVKLMGRYEVQILDSYKNKTYLDGMCAAIYKQRPPMVNASRKPGDWQTYDIIFEAPRFDKDGKLLKPAYLTVFHNGVLVQNHVELKGQTSYNRAPFYRKHNARLPLLLAYHGQPIRFRNIWIREFKELVGKQKKK